MIKKLFFIPCAAITVASCSSNDPVAIAEKENVRADLSQDSDGNRFIKYHAFPTRF
ncbi:MAG: hypothetical protein LBP56_04645 [Odoribacteraceae bacterium]|nr:hypothetical protein [Odoribacteraceae bacterium]